MPAHCVTVFETYVCIYTGIPKGSEPTISQPSNPSMATNGLRIKASTRARPVVTHVAVETAS